MSRSLLLAGGVAVVVLAAAGIGAANFLVAPTLNAPPPAELPVVNAEGKVVGHYVMPEAQAILAAPNADQILFGRRLLNETARLLPANVGNGLNCNSCHMGDGEIPEGNPYINSVNFYPHEMPRAGKEVSLVMRINGCFQRSMNGKPLKPDSAEMQALVAYMTWLKGDVAKADRVDILNAAPINTRLVPDPANGAVIFAAKCATCHGDQGEGMKDAAGHYIFPPLWGDESFNIGAGMARTYKAAAFVKAAMPPAMSRKPPLGEGGVLTDQEAVDVAEFFTHMPRPDFAGKVNDWPNGNKPKDARY